MDLEAAYARVGPRLYRYALAVLGSAQDAEEIVQDLFMTLGETKVSPENPDHYLMRSARNLCLERLATASRRRRLLQENAFRLMPREGGSEALEGFAKRASEALGTLPPEQREAVALHLFEGMTFQEIAAVTEVPQDTAASRYRYGIEKLQEILRDERP